MADDSVETVLAFDGVVDQTSARMRELTRSADLFAGTMTRAFSQSVVGGKSFDDILKSLALRMSDLALRAAFRPVENALSSGLSNLFGGLLGAGGGIGGGGSSLAAAMGAVKPFAAGGIIGTPTYFPLSGGGLGLAGEAGPEAIMPLARGADGRLGVAAAGGRAPNVTIHIMTPDVEGFRRSEAYVAGQIARAVARGQRSL